MAAELGPALNSGHLLLPPMARAPPCSISLRAALLCSSQPSSSPELLPCSPGRALLPWPLRTCPCSLLLTRAGFLLARLPSSLFPWPSSLSGGALASLGSWPRALPAATPNLLPCARLLLGCCFSLPRARRHGWRTIRVRRSSLARLYPVRTLLASVSRAVASPSHHPLISSIPCAHVSGSTWSSFGRGLILALYSLVRWSGILLPAHAFSLRLAEVPHGSCCARPGPNVCSPLFLLGSAMELATTPAVLPTCARPSTRACHRLALALACLLVVTAARSLFVHRVSRVLAFALSRRTHHPLLDCQANPLIRVLLAVNSRLTSSFSLVHISTDPVSSRVCVIELVVDFISRRLILELDEKVRQVRLASARGSTKCLNWTTVIVLAVIESIRFW